MRFNDFLQNLDLSYDDSMDELLDIQQTNKAKTFFNPFDEGGENLFENHNHKEVFFEKTSVQASSKVNLAIKTSAYPMLKQWLEEGKKVPAQSIKIDEMINSFENQALAAPNLMNVYTELCVCPWNESNVLLQIILSVQKPTYLSKQSLEGKPAQFLERKLLAQQVVLQAKFDPEMVESYQLIGYENQVLDSNSSQEPFAKNSWYTGQQACLFYEIVPKKSANKDSLLSLKVNFLANNQSYCAEKTIHSAIKSFSESSDYLRFSIAVAMFGMFLKGSKTSGKICLQQISNIANQAYEHRNYKQQEFLKMLKVGFLF
ncbi:MAG: DUF3520 domain-containing protein [Bacteroidetes bacterium]|nr:MAG: DUF3520 domain-containing protein [Bacteroidota bacterium]